MRAAARTVYVVDIVDSLWLQAKKALVWLQSYQCKVNVCRCSWSVVVLPPAPPVLPPPPSSRLYEVPPVFSTPPPPLPLLLPTHTHTRSHARISCCDVRNKSSSVMFLCWTKTGSRESTGGKLSGPLPVDTIDVAVSVLMLGSSCWLSVHCPHAPTQNSIICTHTRITVV